MKQAQDEQLPGNVVSSSVCAGWSRSADGADGRRLAARTSATWT